MKSHVYVMLLLGLMALSGCFLSAEPRIETGVMLARGPVAFCVPDDPPCKIGYPSGDGYQAASDDPGEDSLQMRFEALTEAGGVTVYLGEIELRAGDETGWIYVVARPQGGTVEAAPRYEMAMPECNDNDPDRDAEFGIVRQDAYSCTVTDLAAFRSYLLTVQAANLADPDWWAEQ